VIGKPLRSRRVLMQFVCPVEKAADKPDVNVSPVLEIPSNAAGMWAEGDVMPIVKALNERLKDTTFAPSEKTKKPPFSVMLAAENKKSQSKIVVMGMGASMVGNYLDAPVPRIDTRGEVRLTTESPPVENAELFTNALYWLGGQEKLIAAGPAEVPFVGPITEASEKRLWVITMCWAAAVLVVGGAVMFVRRR
jgi:hypothetical protein